MKLSVEGTFNRKFAAGTFEQVLKSVTDTLAAAIFRNMIQIFQNVSFALHVRKGVDQNLVLPA